jgi:hypothetical protein
VSCFLKSQNWILVLFFIFVSSLVWAHFYLNKARDSSIMYTYKKVIVFSQLIKFCFDLAFTIGFLSLFRIFFV